MALSENELVAKVVKWSVDRQLWAEGDTIVVACSGGADSLALLEFFLTIRHKYDLNIIAAHLDHMFRGQYSAADAEFVRQFCRLRQVPFYFKQFDVPAYAAAQGLSDEDAARRVRYEFLTETASQCRQAKIATGHHKDDQAETVLLNLLRGAGSRGLKAMQPRRGDIIRPFLAVTRREIEEFCQVHSLAARIDSTNGDMKYLRNRVRLELLPLLKERYNGAVVDSLCRSAAIFEAESRFIGECAQRELSGGCAVVNDKRATLDRRQFKDLHLALQREVVRLVLYKICGGLQGVQFEHIENAVALIARGRVGACLELPHNMLLKCTYDKSELKPRESAADEDGKAVQVRNLTVPGITAIPELGLSIETSLPGEFIAPADRNGVVVDWDKVKGSLYIRTRRFGDKFTPSGFNGRKKLQDFFIDAKVPRQLRDKIPLLCSRGEIIWIGGYRQNQSSRVGKQTKRFLCVKIIDDGRI